VGIGGNKTTIPRWLVWWVGIRVDGENQRGMGLGWEKMGWGGLSLFHSPFC